MKLELKAKIGSAEIVIHDWSDQFGTVATINFPFTFTNIRLQRVELYRLIEIVLEKGIKREIPDNIKSLMIVNDLKNKDLVKILSAVRDLDMAVSNFYRIKEKYNVQDNT